MRGFKRFIIWVVIYGVMVSCYAHNSNTFDHSFNEFLKDVKAYSIKNRDWGKSDWDFYLNNQQRKLPITTTDDFYQSVQEALNDLGDHHSFLIKNTSQETEKDLTTDVISIQVENGIGIINFPTFTQDSAPTEAFISQFHKKLDEMKLLVTKGWIINLQNNLGGNMYPMLACLSDFLVNRNLGGFYSYGQSVNDRIQKVTFDGKTFAYNGVSILTYKDTYSMGTITFPTIVLISAKTGSSAEFLTLALKRQSSVTLVGQTTRGLATGNELMSLPNHLGNYMLTVAHYLDENDAPLLTEKIEPQITLEPMIDQVEEAKIRLSENN